MAVHIYNKYTSQEKSIANEEWLGTHYEVKENEPIIEEIVEAEAKAMEKVEGEESKFETLVKEERRLCLYQY